jgi:hypothetical protein
MTGFPAVGAAGHSMDVNEADRRKRNFPTGMNGLPGSRRHI